MPPAEAPRNRPTRSRSTLAPKKPSVSLIVTFVANPSISRNEVVLNTTAVHPERTIYTLNSIGFAVCPYRIQHDEELWAELRNAGYKRRDAWRNEGKPIEVPFVEGGDKPYYAGCCFDLAG